MTEFQRPLHTLNESREYSVLLPVLKEKEGPALLFTVRSSRLRHHPGEVCFPGGRNEGESRSETAVRECCEELKLRPEQIRVFSALPGQIGPDGAAVWPFLGEVTGYQGSFSEEEVGEVLTVPFSEIREAPCEVHRVRLIMEPEEDFPWDLLPGGRDYPFRAKHQEFPFFRLRGKVVYGLTARILRDLLAEEVLSL